MKPKVAVLLAAYNGLNFLPKQIYSILKQTNVDVDVFVSVDFSGDGTERWLNELAEKELAIKLLSHGKKIGGAGKNFYRLIQEVDFESFDYVAFADQDDIWQPDKLIRHIKIAESQGADGVSSDVMAFWPNHKQKLIHKSQSQKKWDFLFESAGPGCTFLMTPWLVGMVRKELNKPDSPAKDVALHDWLTYAICRAHHRNWVIDTYPSVLYRQHQDNVLGVNAGLRAAYARLNKVRSGWYWLEVSKIARICYTISNDKNIKLIGELVTKRGFMDRLQLLKYIPQSRRKLADRFALAFFALLPPHLK